MSTHEFTFGGVPWSVVTIGTPSTATMYVIVNDGASLQPVADQNGKPIELVATQEIDSLGLAARGVSRRR